jgi:hypothetical protein
MSHKTLGNLISWSFVGLSALCLLGALLLAVADPGEGSLALVTTCSLGLATTTYLASWK